MEKGADEELAFWLEPLAITVNYSRSDLKHKPLARIVKPLFCYCVSIETDFRAAFPCEFIIDEGEVYGQTTVPINGLCLGVIRPQRLRIEISTEDSAKTILFSSEFELTQST